MLTFLRGEIIIEIKKAGRLNEQLGLHNSFLLDA